MADPRRILRQHLRTDELLGVEAVPMGHAAAAAAPARESEVQSPKSEVVRAATPPPARRTSDIGLRTVPLDRETKLRVLTELNENEVRACEKCDLCSSRTQTVFGEGNPDADIMFIGEGPGQNEDEQGRPFVGRAGDLLTKMIIAMGLSRDDVYIANIVKCRPPNNRAPTPAETSACWDFLNRQIQIIRPKAIVTLGGPATKTLLDNKEGITRLRGTWHEYAGVNPPIPVMPTFHPAYVLRNYTPETRGKVWSDLQAVLDMVRD